MVCFVNSVISDDVLKYTKNNDMLDVYKNLLACKKKELSLVIFSTSEWDYDCHDYTPYLSFTKKINKYFQKHDITEVYLCDCKSNNEGNISLCKVVIKYNLFISDNITNNSMYLFYMFFTTPKLATIFKLLV